MKVVNYKTKNIRRKLYQESVLDMEKILKNI